MPAIPVDLLPRPVEIDEVELVDDMDEVVESSKCSCNAGDDNPY